MLTITQAIKTLFTSNSTLTSTFTGGFALNTMPDNTTTFPYAVAQWIAAPMEPKYGGAHHVTGRVAFKAYALSALAALTAAEAMYPIIEAASLSCYSQRRLTDAMCAKAGFQSAGQMVWVAVVDFELDYQ